MLKNFLPITKLKNEYKVFLKWAIPSLSLFIFVFSIQLAVNK